MNDQELSLQGQVGDRLKEQVTGQHSDATCKCHL